MTAPPAAGRRRALPLRFVAAGAFNTALGYVLFRTFLHVLGGAAAAAQALTYAVGVGVAYLVSRFWTFGAFPTAGRAFPRFVATHLGALAFSSALLRLAVDRGGAPPTPAWVAVMAATTVFSFLVQRAWVFAAPEPPARRDA